MQKKEKLKKATRGRNGACRRNKIVPQKPHSVHSFGGAEEVKVKKSHAEEKWCVAQVQDRSKKPRREEAKRGAGARKVKKATKQIV